MGLNFSELSSCSRLNGGKYHFIIFTQKLLRTTNELIDILWKRQSLNLLVIQDFNHLSRISGLLIW